MEIKKKFANLWYRFQSSAPDLKIPVNARPLKNKHVSPSSDLPLFDLIPVDQSLTDRWDREWLTYFRTENPRPFLIDHQNLKVITSLSGKTPSEVYNTYLVSVKGMTDLPKLGPLGIWVKGDDLVGKRVLEIGCGPGFLSKQVAKIAAWYMGIDYSQLALYIARLTSPSNCGYYHLADLAAISQHAGTMDTMVGRNFFIHQNYQNLTWLLALAAVLLKPGGLISADFYLRNPAIPQGIIHPARRKLDERYPSCGFEYTELDIKEAASETGFMVESITDNLELQRRFVFFRKVS